jgi:hypothetical protein
MTGVFESMASLNKINTTDKRIVGGIYVVADGDNDNDNGNDEHDDNEGARNANFLRRNICAIEFSGLPSTMKKKSKKKNNTKRGVSVATKSGGFSPRPVDLMCSQFPTDVNSTVGVDVSCGAMNAFSNDVPYNSAGLSLVRSVDTNPGGFLSQNNRRRRRPTISSLGSSPLSHSYDEGTTPRRLMTSGINIPTRSRRATFRSPSLGVERFNYAKALLRSDHELEKLSRKIRSEINESELFELALAAERAASLGEDNFSGRASTFGGKINQQRQEESTKTKTGFPVIGHRKPLIGDDATNHSSLAQTSRQSFPEQSLLEHARAAAAAVVVPTPLKTIQKEPERRSMCIDSLRDVNEVIPQWKELHGHMRTHFHRSNVKTNSLFFCEKESSPTPPNAFSARNNGSPSSKIGAKENKKTTNQRRAKSFFNNILPDFRPKISPQQKALNSQSDDDTNKIRASKTRESDTLDIDSFGTILSSHISPKTKDFGKIQSPDLCVPPGLAHPDEFKNYNGRSLNEGASPKFENEDNRQGQATSLTARLLKRPESFDLEELRIPKKLPASSQRPIDSQTIDKNDDDDNHNDDIQSEKNSVLGSPAEYKHGYIEAKSIVSSPKGKYESSCPVSPSNDSTLRELNSLYAGSLSPTAPSTPNNSVIPRRKDSGFSTPAHLRMIKRLHGSFSDEKRSSSNDHSEQSKSEGMQDFEFEDEAYATTPAGVYSQFEPNSIVQTSPRRSRNLANPSLRDAETTLLALPTIQGTKRENELQNISRSFARRTVRTQWQNGSISPPDSPTTPTGSTAKIMLRGSEERIDSDCETPSVVAKAEFGTTRMHSETEKYTCVEDSKTLSSSKLISCINPPDDLSALQPPHVESLVSRMQDNLNENSIIQYGEKGDEKKECDSATSSLNPNSHRGKNGGRLVNEEHHQYALHLSPLRNERKNEDHLRTKHSSSIVVEDATLSLQQKKNDDSEYSPLRGNGSVSNLKKRIEKSRLIPRMKLFENESSSSTTALETIDSIQTAESKDFLSTNSIQGADVRYVRNYGCDASSGDNLSVCHSLQSTDVTFKAAVKTVQGVAVQTVQEVFSHLSLGSPKVQLQSKELQSESDNQEFLRNYFYCAKAGRGKKLRHASANQGNESPLEIDGERLICIEPCNGRESPCYMFGIDTMCGGLIDLLPHDDDMNSITKSQQTQDRNGVLSHATMRDRSSSISMGQIQHMTRRHSHSVNHSYQHQDEGTWLNKFQRVASERFNIQFQTEENDLEKSRHPYTPPCLSRKLPNPNQTL